MVCALAHLGGHPVGIVANQPSEKGGAIDSDGAMKGSHFIEVCDSFHVPLIFLGDNPGVMAGSEAEHESILRYGGRMFASQMRTTTIKFHVTFRKAYGFGGWYDVFLQGTLNNFMGVRAKGASELARQGQEWFVERGAAAIYREAAQLVSDHRRAGTPVVFLSGGMDFLVAPVARALGAVRWAAVEPEVQDGVLTGRLREPLLKPSETEREGYVPNVVYSCGALIHNRELILPYAMSDYATNFATVSLDEILGAME